VVLAEAAGLADHSLSQLSPCESGFAKWFNGSVYTMGYNSATYGIIAGFHEQLKVLQKDPADRSHG
jgi:hypothetical protein